MEAAAPNLRAVLVVDSRLCRRVVDLAADRARDAGDGELARDLSGELEPIYASAADPAERMAKFESAYRRLFAEWGYEGLLAGMLE